MKATATHNEKIARTAAPNGKPPKFRPLQLATLVDAVPSGNDWFHEIKYDGYRALVAAAGRAVVVYTRSALDWTDKFAPLAQRIAALRLPPCLIDRQIVSSDARGNPDFSPPPAVPNPGACPPARKP